MAKMIGSSAIVFKAELPDAAAMEKHLESLIHEPIQSFELQRVRLSHTPHGERLTKFPGGYAFTLLIERKVLPHDVVQKELKQSVEGFKQMEGRKPTKKETAHLKEMVVNDLLPQAFVREKHITCYYWAAKNYLVMPIASKPISQLLMGRIVEAVESVRTSTVHINGLTQGLTARLKKFIADEEDRPFGEFEPGELVELRDATERELYNREGLESSKDGILNSINQGFAVKQLELKRGEVTFRLTNALQFRSIDIAYEVDEDEEEVWKAHATLWMTLFADALDELLDMFGYKPEEESA